MKIKRKHLFHYIIIVIWLLFGIMPSLIGYNTEASLVVGTLWGLIFVPLFSKLSKSEQQVLILMALFVGLVVFYKIIGVSTSSFGAMIGYFGWLVAVAIGIFIRNLFSLERQISVLWAIYIIFAISVLLILVLGKQMDLSLESTISELGTASFSTSCMLLSGVFFIYVLNGNSFAKKVMFLILIAIISYVNIIILQRGTNVILTFALLGLIFLFNTEKKNIPIILIVIGSIVLLVIYYTGAYVDLIKWVIKISPSERVANRFKSILVLVQTRDYITAGTSIRTRGMLLKVSWDAFTNSFWSVLFGVGDHRIDNSQIGNHFEILDTFARYGIFGGIILIEILKSQRRILLRLFDNNFSKKMYSQCMVVFAIYVFRNIFGADLSIHVGIVLFIALPTIIKIIQFENKNAIDVFEKKGDI